MKPNDVIAVVVIILFILLIAIGVGIYNLVNVARQNMRGTVTSGSSSTGSSGEIDDGP
jgi:hypothetical protein